MTEEEIKKEIYNKARQLPWEQFEDFCADLLEKCGYRNVKVTQRTRDGGVDIYADAHNKNWHFFHVCFQVKKYLDPWKVSGPQVEKYVNGPGYKQAGAGSIISFNGKFSNPAIKYSDEHGIRRIGGQDLTDLAYKYHAGYKEDGSLDQAYWDEIARKSDKADKKK